MTITAQQRREWGRLGGHVRKARLSPRRRSEIARKAVAAREAKRKNGA